MFSLIIAIISIALVVGLVAATMYSGGSSLSKGKQEAEVAKAVNEVGQISAAIVAFKVNEGVEPDSIQSLVPKYLSGVPKGWGVEIADAPVAFESSQLLQGDEAQKLEMCTEVNTKLGLTGAPPACNSIDANFKGCCVSGT